MAAPVATPVPGAPQASTFVRSAASVAVATGLGNVLVYVLYAALSRSLGPTSYGAYAALAALGFVAAVPALAVQAVVGRHVAVRGLDGPDARDEVRVLLGWANRFGLVLAVVAVALAPFVDVFLHLPGPFAAVWNGVWLWPTTVLGAYLGVLQGAGRLRSFGLLFLTASTARLVLTLAGALAGKHYGAGLGSALVGTTLAAGVAVLLGSRLVGVAPFRGAHERRHLMPETVGASSGLLGVVVLCNVDLLLARHYLTGHASGIYAVGTIIAKGVFFLPAFVGYVRFRDFTDATMRQRTITRALGVVVALAALAVAATALVAGPVVKLASGAHYAAIAGNAWLFALLGAALACVQLLVYADIAAGHHGLARLVWVAVGGEIVVLAGFAHGSVTELVVAAVVVNMILACVSALCVVRPATVGRLFRR